MRMLPKYWWRIDSRKVYLWDVKTGREVWSFVHPEAANTLPLTADGKRFSFWHMAKADTSGCFVRQGRGRIPAAGPEFSVPSMRAAGVSFADGKACHRRPRIGEGSPFLDARGEPRVRIFDTKGKAMAHLTVFSFPRIPITSLRSGNEHPCLGLDRQGTQRSCRQASRRGRLRLLCGRQDAGHWTILASSRFGESANGKCSASRPTQCRRSTE